MKHFLSMLSSRDGKVRELAIELCLELVDQPSEDFITDLSGFTNSHIPELRESILNLMARYEEFLDTNYGASILDFVHDSNDAVRLAAYRFIQASNAWPPVLTLLDASQDVNEEIRLIACEGLQRTILCENSSFRVAEYLNH